LKSPSEIGNALCFFPERLLKTEKVIGPFKMLSKSWTLPTLNFSLLRCEPFLIFVSSLLALSPQFSTFSLTLEHFQSFLKPPLEFLVNFVI